MTVLPGAHQPASGYDEAETLCMDPPDPESGLESMDSSDDPGAALDRARVIVVAGGGVSSRESYVLVAELARALGGELAATSTLCERGLAPADRAIGVGHRHVTPTLYVVCAASGSRQHLDAVSPGAIIVAIDHDPDAPVFAAARYGVVGELETVVPALIAALNERLTASELEADQTGASCGHAVLAPDTADSVDTADSAACAPDSAATADRQPAVMLPSAAELVIRLVEDRVLR
jgi:electron transfer flavoprotein alpha subunit